MKGLLVQMVNHSEKNGVFASFNNNPETYVNENPGKIHARMLYIDMLSTVSKIDCSDLTSAERGKLQSM